MHFLKLIVALIVCALACIDAAPVLQDLKEVGRGGGRGNPGAQPTGTPPQPGSGGPGGPQESGSPEQQAPPPQGRPRHRPPPPPPTVTSTEDIVSDPTDITEAAAEATETPSAEHNDGELSTLKEVTLHQFDIEKIENLDLYCRNLEILFLQNNLIGKIENVGKLKCLKYLNLALNNIKVIENLEGCESLQKLDLTVNFVSNLLDLENLKCNQMLRELYLVGNPVYNVENYRAFAAWTLPQLKVLDGIEIEKSERIAAGQIFEDVKKDYIETAAKEEKEEESSSKQEEDSVPLEEKDLETLKQEFQTKLVPHTPESRLETAKTIQKMKGTTEEDQEKTKPKKKKRPSPDLPGPDGRVLQRNEGKWNFWYTNNDATMMTLNIEISKFLDSSFIDVEPHDTWIRVIIKEKILQLVLDSPIIPGEIVCERSKLSGLLAITMKKRRGSEAGRGEGEDKSIVELITIKKRENAAKPNIAKQTRGFVNGTNKRLDRLLGDTFLAGLAMKKEGASPAAGPVIQEARILPSDVLQDFVDDPDVPPLC
ncbi:Protein tilB [Phlyctochytrium planicorne]|nr:Protein tilB [Phlyctochytrium planicorne]